MYVRSELKMLQHDSLELPVLQEVNFRLANHDDFEQVTNIEQCLVWYLTRTCMYIVTSM